MTPRLHLRRLAVTGPLAKRSEIAFLPGLNVIQGAANTGKSHIVALINFLLGSSSIPTPIPEQAGYDASFLSVGGSVSETFTMARVLVGGDFRLADGLTEQWPENGAKLTAKHRSDGTSLSEFLLAKLDMEGRRLRKNAKGESVNLSFRNLVHLALIPEGKIQSDVSPVETGQYVSRTVDFSAFKYLLTGEDDRLLDIVARQKPDATKRAHQLELLDRQLMDVAVQIERSTSDPEDLQTQDQRISSAIAEELAQFETTGADYRELTLQRRKLRKSRELLGDRNDEIELLLARFHRLAEHYGSDIQRLQAIAEAGSFFLLRGADTCPMCGALPDHQHASACEGDVERIRAAAEAEIKRIEIRKGELGEVIVRLTIEAQENAARIPDLDHSLMEVEGAIREELPDVRAARERIDDLMSTRSGVQKGLVLVQRQSELKDLRNELGDESTDAISLIAEASIVPQMKDDFARTVEDLLNQWGYPTENRVYFDLKTRDIEVAGKPRKANGKGVRAVLHAAFSIGLARHCFEKNLPHPGFVILDSPLVTYRDPLEADEKQLARTDLKTRFFNSLRALPEGIQLVIFENVDLPNWLKEAPGTTIFTGSSSHGRKGFYK